MIRNDKIEPFYSCASVIFGVAEIVLIGCVLFHGSEFSSISLASIFMGSLSIISIIIVCIVGGIKATDKFKIPTANKWPLVQEVYPSPIACDATPYKSQIKRAHTHTHTSSKSRRNINNKRRNSVQSIQSATASITTNTENTKNAKKTEKIEKIEKALSDTDGKTDIIYKYSKSGNGVQDNLNYRSNMTVYIETVNRNGNGDTSINSFRTVRSYTVHEFFKQMGSLHYIWMHQMIWISSFASIFEYGILTVIYQNDLLHSEKNKMTLMWYLMYHIAFGVSLINIIIHCWKVLAWVVPQSPFFRRLLEWKVFIYYISCFITDIFGIFFTFWIFFDFRYFITIDDDDENQNSNMSNINDDNFHTTVATIISNTVLFVLGIDGIFVLFIIFCYLIGNLGWHKGM